jgi:hypothetical protein
VAYPQGAGTWPFSVASTRAAKAAFLSVGALALMLTGLALSGDVGRLPTVNRAGKADSLVSSAELKAKHGQSVAWFQFFHARDLADPEASNRFDGMAVPGEVRLEKVAVNDASYLAW